MHHLPRTSCTAPGKPSSAAQHRADLPKVAFPSRSRLYNVTGARVFCIAATCCLSFSRSQKRPKSHQPSGLRWLRIEYWSQTPSPLPSGKGLPLPLPLPIEKYSPSSFVVFRSLLARLEGLFEGSWAALGRLGGSCKGLGGLGDLGASWGGVVAILGAS